MIPRLPLDFALPICDDALMINRILATELDALRSVLDTDDSYMILRDAICDRSCDMPFDPSPMMTNPLFESPDLNPIAIAAIDDTLRRCFAAEYPYNDAPRELLTEIALATSLCPLHFCDYAICFDDDDPECASIRTIHPSHDT